MTKLEIDSILENLEYQYPEKTREAIFEKLKYTKPHRELEDLLSLKWTKTPNPQKLIAFIKKTEQKNDNVKNKPEKDCPICGGYGAIRVLNRQMFEASAGATGINKFVQDPTIIPTKNLPCACRGNKLETYIEKLNDHTAKNPNETAWEIITLWVHYAYFTQKTTFEGFCKNPILNDKTQLIVPELKEHHKKTIEKFEKRTLNNQSPPNPPNIAISEQLKQKRTYTRAKAKAEEICTNLEAQTDSESDVL